MNPPGSRIGVGVLTGSICGFLLGAVVDAIAWVFSFFVAFDGTPPVAPWIVMTTRTSTGDVTATTGLGVLLLPIALTAIGAAIGNWVGTARLRRTASSPHQPAS